MFPVLILAAVFLLTAVRQVRGYRLEIWQVMCGGAAAVRALDEGKSGVMVALDPPTVRYVPLAEISGRMKTVPPDCDSIVTARDLGICMGD